MYCENDLVRIAKRDNNKKRNYLVLDPLQGKHYPVSPTESLKLFETLAEQVKGKYPGEKLLVIGFAETATAIGAQVALCLDADYIQTTREVIEGVSYLFFSEEHSHATEQKLVKEDMDRALREADRILFVEDEVTTGKTILNIVTILEKQYPERLKFSVASLLNGMTEEHLMRYQQKGIGLHWLVKTDHSGYPEIAEKFHCEGNYVSCDVQAVSLPEEKRISGVVNTRRLTTAKQYREACEKLWKGICEQTEITAGEKILVIGTEECMYPAIYVGKKLEEAGCRVKTHSTTRSPISVGCEEGYPLQERYELRSLYDENRVTYLYNIGTYDAVWIVTDAVQSGSTGKNGLTSLVNALKEKNSKIEVIRWC